MAKKYTHQDFLDKLQEKGKELTPLETYVNSKTKILFKCNKCGYEWRAAPNQILYKTGCPECKKVKLSALHTMTKEQFEKKMQEQRPRLKVFGQYQGTHNPVELICDKGHIWHLNQANVAFTPAPNGGCPYCNGRILIPEENSVAAKRPDLIKYFQDKQMTTQIMPRSTKKVDFVCPDCGHIKSMSMDNLTTRGFHCNFCSDNISYPNRILRSFLKQVSCQLDEDYQLEWYSAPYRFDGYFILHSQQYVIEMHGLQHYQQVFPNVSLSQQQKRDAEKRKICHDLGIIEVEIDCSNSNFDFIKTNLCSNSVLSSIFDLSCIDWLELREGASKNLIKEAATLFKQNKSNVEISRVLKLDRHTVASYLKEAIELGWL